eukprot:4916222-Amphidinium_carterae.1
MDWYSIRGLEVCVQHLFLLGCSVCFCSFEKGFSSNFGRRPCKARVKIGMRNLATSEHVVCCELTAW